MAGNAKGGSSPLARGTALNWILSERRFPVHPRWRGEQALASATAGVASGSSPLARGTVVSWTSPTVSRAVHPRWRGEQGHQVGAPEKRAGSFPLARGTAKIFTRGVDAFRFIPAGAGNRSFSLA